MPSEAISINWVHLLLAYGPCLQPNSSFQVFNRTIDNCTEWSTNNFWGSILFCSQVPNKWPYQRKRTITTDHLVWRPFTTMHQDTSYKETEFCNRLNISNCSNFAKQRKRHKLVIRIEWRKWSNCSKLVIPQKKKKPLKSPPLMPQQNTCWLNLYSRNTDFVSTNKIQMTNNGEMAIWNQVTHDPHFNPNNSSKQSLPFSCNLPQKDKANQSHQIPSP